MGKRYDENLSLRTADNRLKRAIALSALCPAHRCPYLNTERVR